MAMMADGAAAAPNAARLALAALSDLASPTLAQRDPAKMRSMSKEPKGSALGRAGAVSSHEGGGGGGGG